VFCVTFFRGEAGWISPLVKDPESRMLKLSQLFSIWKMKQESFSGILILLSSPLRSEGMFNSLDCYD
jgi:hypothetical protein